MWRQPAALKCRRVTGQTLPDAALALVEIEGCVQAFECKSVAEFAG